MAKVKYLYEIAATAVVFSGTRTLVSLDIDEWTDLSDAIDNTTLGYLKADFEFVCTSVAFTGTDSDIELYIIPSVDGTNYPDWAGDGVVELQEQNVHLVGVFKTSGTTSAQRLTLRDIELPPGLFKVGVRNRGGIALAGSGSTLKYRPGTFSNV